VPTRCRPTSRPAVRKVRITASPGLSPSLYAFPVSGWIARDIARGPDTIRYALVILLTVLVLAVKTWGLVALALTALAAVPVMFVLLIALTQG
jgi:hypothetical protein